MGLHRTPTPSPAGPAPTTEPRERLRWRAGATGRSSRSASAVSPAAGSSVRRAAVGQWPVDPPVFWESHRSRPRGSRQSAFSSLTVLPLPTRRSVRAAGVLPLDEFARDASKASGYKSWCKACDNAKSRDYCERNRGEGDRSRVGASGGAAGGPRLAGAARTAQGGVSGRSCGTVKREREAA